MNHRISRQVWLALALLGCLAWSESKAQATLAPIAPLAQQAQAAPQATDSESTRVEIVVDGDGFKPSAIKAKAGVPTILAFRRVSDAGCAKEVVFPTLKIRKALPLNQTVEIRVVPSSDETIVFTCGMGMYRGTVVAAAK